jgi:hypothetical protein
MGTVIITPNCYGNKSDSLYLLFCFMGVYGKTISIKEEIVMECCLTKGELIRVGGGKGGLVLRCTVGSIWLTCGDGADYLLTAGRSFELPARRLALIEAMTTAEYCFGEPAVSGVTVRRLLMGFTAS